jgi:hypothetical protein
MAPRWWLVCGALGVLGVALSAGACTAPGGSNGGGGASGGAAGGGGGSSAGGSGGVTESTGSGGSGAWAVGCGVGPMLESWDCGPDEFTPTIFPECPEQPAGGSQPLVDLLACRYAGEAGCEPHWSVYGCPESGGDHWYPDEVVIFHDNVYQHIGNVDISVKMTASGTFIVDWTVQKLDEQEQPLGEPMTGQAELPGYCCAVEFDVHFPEHDHTVRYLVQTDWEQPS